MRRHLRNRISVFSTIPVWILLCLPGQCTSLENEIMSNSEQYLKLSSGYDMPTVGLGTWQIEPNEADIAVTTALENGYRHIDTAFLYANEEAIGKSLKKWFNKGNKREDVFITTKIPPFANRAADVEMYLKLSLERLDLQYVDMYLIHLPFGFLPPQADGGLALDFSTDHVTLWKAMEAQVKAGRAKSIGLSNFNESQIMKVLNNAEIKPSNLQIELHAYHQQKPLRKLCAEHNIVVTGYASLGSPGAGATATNQKPFGLMKHPTIVEIAEAHKKSTAQVLLRHSVQNGIVVIPKSINPERIKANHDIFDFKLSSDEMQRIDDMDMGQEGKMITVDNIFEGIDKHPEFPWPGLIKNA